MYNSVLKLWSISAILVAVIYTWASSLINIPYLKKKGTP